MPRINNEEIKDIADEALADFWNRVSKRLPMAKTGDIVPEASAALAIAAKHAVSEWVRLNVKQQEEN